jgi:hypothetical protein
MLMIRTRNKQAFSDMLKIKRYFCSQKWTENLTVEKWSHQSVFSASLIVLLVVRVGSEVVPLRQNFEKTENGLASDLRHPIEN